jgi:hypothetical protein
MPNRKRYVQTELIVTVKNSFSFFGLLIKWLYALKIIDFLWLVATQNIMKLSNQGTMKTKFSKLIEVQNQNSCVIIE